MFQLILMVMLLSDRCVCMGSNTLNYPRNAAVVAGQRVIMGSCRTSGLDGKIQWDLCLGESDVNSNCSTVASGMKVAKKMEQILEVNDRFDLIIKSASASEAGIYKCLEVVKDVPRRRTAQLIVFFANPECRTSARANTTSDPISVDDRTTFKLWCSVRFRGNWTPSMQWSTFEGKIISEGVSQDVVRLSDHHSTTSLFTLPVNARSLFGNEIRFNCTTYFQEKDQSMSPDMSQEFPEFKFTWTTPQLVLPNEKSSDFNTHKIVLISVCVTVTVVLLCFAIFVRYYSRKINLMTKRICPCTSTGYGGSYSNSDAECKSRGTASIHSGITVPNNMASLVSIHSRGMMKLSQSHLSETPSNMIVYAQVNKKAKTMQSSAGTSPVVTPTSATTHLSDRKINPTYEEIPANAEDKDFPNNKDVSRLERNAKKTKVGEDGTVYEDVNRYSFQPSKSAAKGAAASSTNGRDPRAPPAYASIDHTLPHPSQFKSNLRKGK